MPIITLVLLSGCVASMVVGLLFLLFTKPLMARGFRAFGFWGGLILLMIVFGTGQYYFTNYYRSSFIKTGPCPTCCELCGLTFLFWWIAWGIGLILYFVVFNKRYSEIKPLPTPQWLKISVPIGIFCIIIGVISFRLWKDNSERTRLRTNIALIENSVLAGNLTEIGSIQLPQSAKYWTVGNVSFVSSVKISPDGKWFSLQYKDKIEIWRMLDITSGKVFHSGPSILDSIAFSPDSSNFAIWTDGKLSVYSLANAMVWEFDDMKNYVSDLGFSKDGKELVIANSYGIETFDANNGNRLQTVAIPSENGFYVKRLSNNSEYVVTGNEKVFQLYNRHNGQLLHEIEKPGGTILPSNDVLFFDFFDCKQSAVEIWDKETGDEVSFDVAGDYCWPTHYFAFTQDSNTSVLAGLHNFAILDLKNKIQIDLIPIQPAITALAISPDGYVIIVATADGRLNFYANMMSEN